MEVYEVVDSADIAAPPQRVWEIVSDIAVMPRFSTELRDVQWADGFDGPALGAKFLGHNRNRMIGEWTTRSQITAFDRPRAFGWSVGDPEMPSATWRFDLAPRPGGTRLTYTAQIGPGPSGVTMLIERSPHRAERIVESRLAQFREAMAATLTGIGQLAEKGSG
jgi:carbon monoxide dehydrogenase subunit G